MMKRILFVGALVSLLLVGCTGNLESDFSGRVIKDGLPMTVRATTGEMPGTKTEVQSDFRSIYWSPGDAINVFYGSGSAGQFTENTLTAPAPYAEFSGTLSVVSGTNESGTGARKFWGVYPYNAANTCDGNSVTITIPSQQAAAAETFANGLNPTVACSTGLDLAFYNVGSWFIFSVSQAGITSATLRGNNHENLVGKVQVTMDSDGKPVSTVKEGVKSITMAAPEGGFIPGKQYFMVLLPQTLSQGYTLTLEKGNQRADCVKSGAAQFERSRYRRKLNADAGLVFSSNITFADAAVKTICVANWDDNNDGELSYDEAAAVSSIGEVFRWNTEITAFDEFRFFTGVISLEYGSFEGCSSLTSIRIPSNVTSIGDYAFTSCSGLTNLEIPDNVTSIGEHAFHGCSNLASIEIPSGVTSIGRSTFAFCSSLASIEIPAGVTAIGEDAFYGCGSVTSIVIPSGVTSIEGYTFCNCSGLTSIEIPSSVTSIGSGAFSRCSSLTSIEIPSGVTSIDAWAFYGCSGLTSIFVQSEIPSELGGSAFDGSSCPIIVPLNSLVSYKQENGWSSYEDRIVAIDETWNNEIVFEDLAVKTICVSNWDFNGDGVFSQGEAAAIKSIGTVFENNTAITSFDEFRFFSNVTSIDYANFQYCSNLTSIKLPSGVTTIDSFAFQYCSNLTSIEIPAGLTNIGTAAFQNCSSLASIEIPAGVTSIGGGAFFGCSSITNIEIPSGITSIESSVFCGCSSLTSIEIPAGVTAIGEEAFRACGGLTSIEIPSGVTSIEAGSFQDCIGLTSIVVPSGVTSIGKNAFRGCIGLTSLDIPSGVTDIGQYAFGYCHLTTIIFRSLNPPTAGNHILIGLGNCLIQVPAASVDAYKAAEGWTSYADRIVAIDDPILNAIEFEDSNVKAICVQNWDLNNDGELSFYEAAAVISVELRVFAESAITSFDEFRFFTGVTSIVGNAFHGCNSLTSIELPSGVTSIGNNAFQYCSSLTGIELPSGVTSIGNYAFYDCSSLTSIELPSGVTSIGNYAFHDCSSLTSIDIPSGVTTIGQGAFLGTGLTSIEIPAGVTSIGNNAFSNCSSLMSIELPSSVTSIGDYAFFDCGSLTSIEIPAGVTSIGNNAFWHCSSLTSIDIPSSVTSIGDRAFQNCSSLVNIVVRPIVPPTAGYNFFFDTGSCNIQVPAASVDTYKAAEGWGDYAGRIVAIVE